MRTLSAEEFKKQYGDEAIEKFGQQEQKPGYFRRVFESIKGTRQGLAKDLETQAETIAGEELQEDPSRIKQAVALGRGGLRTAGAVAKSALAPVMEAPGIKQGVEYVGEKLAGTRPVKAFQEWSGRHPEAAKDIMNTLDITALLGTAKGIETATIKTAQGLRSASKKVGQAVEGGVESTTRGLQGATANAPQNIMNRIARLTPKEQVAFKNTAGKTVGEYLTETGNFGNPQQIITREAQKFVESIKMVDDEFARLPGVYKVGSVDDALKELVKSGAQVSSDNVKAGFFGTAKNLLNKSKTIGLDMSEINQVKRFFEREVKLGYSKLMNPIAVQRATNIDNAIRGWQFKKAFELGFENIGEMNKQTQISKFLINKLGDSTIGKGALNNIGLTDWIILAGGDPTAVGGFLTKKFFSSKAVQAKIAKMLSGKESQGIITPKISMSPAYLNIRALPAPSKLPKRGRYTNPTQGVIEGRAPTTYELQSPQGTHTRINPKTGTRYIRDIKTKKLRIENP